MAVVTAGHCPPARVYPRIAHYASMAPTYVSVFLERPAIVRPLAEHTAALIGDFGASDRVILDAFSGRAPLTGVLPFDLPSSMRAVENSREDVPFDTTDPYLRAGTGIRRASGVAAQRLNTGPSRSDSRGREERSLAFDSEG
ncbi:hypothetical protein [Microbacterium atlanticum]|uniref:hypothetical protein n=1 Tax=Microbacterium atlanticum TaxID=2782168 RepID=UPI001888DABA|nr:hypothetical protein [Microbacterium atlanticum]